MPTHTYTATGTYTVTVTATDIEGASNSPATSSLALVTVQPLIVNAGANQSTNEGTAVTFGPTLSGGLAPYSYSWNFGDGVTATGSLNPSHTYTDNGSYTASVFITDSTGQTAFSIATISVANVAPAASIYVPPAGNTNSPITFVASATDPGITDFNAGLAFNWDFGDGATATGRAPSHSYTSVGTYTVSVSATDSNGATSAIASSTIVIAAATVIPIDSAWLQNHGPAPYHLDQAGATYQLQTDVTVDGTAFIVLNHNITFDLNGHTITYDNSQPITVTNGGFESGTSPTDIPGWDVTQAPAAMRVPAMTGMWGNWMLELPNISTTQTVVSSSVNIPVANVEYAATVTPKSILYGGTVTISVIDTVTGAVLSTATTQASSRGFSPVAKFTPTTTDPVKLKIDVTPPAGQTDTVDLDYVALMTSRNYGVLASPDAYSFPSQTYTAQIDHDATHNLRPSGNLTIKNGTITQGPGSSYGGSNIWAQGLPGLTIDSITGYASGMDTRQVFGKWSSNVVVRNSTWTGGIDRISNRMTAVCVLDFVDAASGIVLIENNTLRGTAQNGIGGSGKPGMLYVGILNNDVRLDSSWTDSYGVASGGENFEISGNTVIPVNGRGIMLSGGAINGSIHDNYAEARERATSSMTLTGCARPHSVSGTWGRLSRTSMSTTTRSRLTRGWG